MTPDLTSLLSKGTIKSALPSPKAGNGEGVEHAIPFTLDMSPQTETPMILTETDPVMGPHLPNADNGQFVVTNETPIRLVAANPDTIATAPEVAAQADIMSAKGSYEEPPHQATHTDRPVTKPTTHNEVAEFAKQALANSAVPDTPREGIGRVVSEYTRATPQHPEPPRGQSSPQPMTSAEQRAEIAKVQSSVLPEQRPAETQAITGPTAAAEKVVDGSPTASPTRPDGAEVGKSANMVNDMLEPRVRETPAVGTKEAAPDAISQKGEKHGPGQIMLSPAPDRPTQRPAETLPVAARADQSRPTWERPHQVPATPINIPAIEPGTKPSGPPEFASAYTRGLAGPAVEKAVFLRPSPSDLPLAPATSAVKPNQPTQVTQFAMLANGKLGDAEVIQFAAFAADAVEGDTALSVDQPSRGTGPNAPNSAGQPIQTQTMRIHSALTQAAQSLSADRPVQVSLNPEELGRVRMTLTPNEQGMTVIIAVERSETLDLVRRNVEDFARDLQDLGFDNLEFEFGQQADPETTDDPGESQVSAGVAENTDDSNLVVQTPSLKSSGIRADGSMDIRI